MKSKETDKGGPGSGRHDAVGIGGDGGHPPGHDANTTGVHKPSEGQNRSGHYAEQPASRNPGKPRSGVRPADLYPERQRRS